MQKQNILRYASVKCTNPGPSPKHQMLFQNAMIWNKTKDDLIARQSSSTNTASKNTRLHTEGSEPYEKPKQLYSPYYTNQARNRQFYQTQQVQFEKKSFEPYGQKLNKGNSEKKFKFVTNFTNLKKYDYTRKQKPAEYVPVWIKKDAPTKVTNNFVDGNLKSFVNIKNSKENTLTHPNEPYFNSKQQKADIQPAANYVKRTVKTQADQVIVSPTNCADKPTVKYFRKSFKNTIRKTQTDEQPFRTFADNQRIQSIFNLKKTSKISNKNDNLSFQRFFNVNNDKVNQDKQNRKTITFQKDKQADDILMRQRYSTNLVEKVEPAKTQKFQPFANNNVNNLQEAKGMNEGKVQKLNNQKYLGYIEAKKTRLNTEQNDKDSKSYLMRQKVVKTNEQQTRQTSSQTIQKAIDWKRDIVLLQKIGEGTFGKVYKAKLRQEPDGRTFAVKKVYIDKKYKSRELQIVEQLNHPQVMKVHNVFVTTKQNSEQYLNIVMDFYDKNLYEVINECDPKQRQFISRNNELRQKVFIYQMLKGVSYIHSLNICHRDIKPHNMLVKGWDLVLCDFGSAKKLISGEQNLSYICSRCYRAPELIFGSTSYTTQIDMWSVACVILEMINGLPLFIGQNSLDHLLEIIKVVGTPTKQQVLQMNPNYDISEYDLPMIKRKSLSKLFPKADPKLLDLVNKLLVYNPNDRLSALQALSHPYFDELRRQDVFNSLEGFLSKEKLRMMFEFSEAEMNLLNKTVEGKRKCQRSFLKDKQPKIPAQVIRRQSLVPSWWVEHRFL